MDLVRADGTGGGTKMVISQQNNMVKVVNLVDCTDLNGIGSRNLVIRRGTATVRKSWAYIAYSYRATD
jgi:hypothetical protein